MTSLFAGLGIVALGLSYQNKSRWVQNDIKSFSRASEFYRTHGDIFKFLVRGLYVLIIFHHCPKLARA